MILVMYSHIYQCEVLDGGRPEGLGDGLLVCGVAPLAVDPQPLLLLEMGRPSVA